ncbi:MAG: BadF/BadG/BcrA/BcrD ATPase family protein [Anaerolineae bacterium]
MNHHRYLVCLEGGGTRCQAAVLDATGTVIATSQASDVNINFVSREAAQAAVLTAVTDVLATAGISGERISDFASALVASSFGPEVFGTLMPNARYHNYTERDVVFARAGLYEPHGVAVVSATGASAWGKRADDGREVFAGGWGSLLGDEGSAYAVGVALLRRATQLYDGRIAAPSRIVEAICQRFDLDLSDFRAGLCEVAYQKPLSRAEIAGLAPIATRLAKEGDPIALQITKQVASDLADLALSVTHRLFDPHEDFDVAAAGGLLNAGALIIDPLRERLAEAFPRARLLIGRENPAIALGRLVLHDHYDMEKDEEK